MLILLIFLVVFRKISKLIVYLLSFFCNIWYHYYGDNMNISNVIINIKNVKDIEKISSDTKYINISIDNVNIEVIDYFLLNGMNYSYSDTINNKNGFIYADYDMFKYGESVIDNIIDSMPSDLNKLEIVRYLYISLGKILSVDINAMNDKNETVSFNKISMINNIWGAISKGKVGDAVVSKIFMYLCSRMDIKCEIISSSIKGNVANKVYLDNSFLIVDLFNDIHNIQGGFCTCCFDKYNDIKEIDRKISYIKEEYMDYYVSEVFSELDYTMDDTLYEILSLTNKIINIGNIGPCELFKIYRNIFDKYAPNYDIRINNLFVYSDLDNKEHFIVFSYNNEYYSFNYNKKCFINVDINVLYDNIKDNKIGIYDDEDFILNEKRVVL